MCERVGQYNLAAGKGSNPGIHLRELDQIRLGSLALGLAVSWASQGPGADGLHICTH